MICYVSGGESIPILIRDPARSVDLAVLLDHESPETTTVYIQVSTRNLKVIDNPHDDFFG
jgi:hypothetical protein